MRESWHANRIEEPQTIWREERLEPSATYHPIKCLEISGSERREIELDVVVENNVNIVLNGGCVTALSAIQKELKEMAVGFLIGEGLVESFQDIASVKYENNSLICETRDGQSGEWRGHQCCSAGGVSFKGFRTLRSDIKMKAGAILKAVDQLNLQAKLWRRTGATHTSIICDIEGDILAACEDVSRSTSVDKAVGTALFAECDLSRCALITSGRLSGVMVAKAARAGFPILVSRSAPMNSGVEQASKIGMTLVAFARSPRLYVYSGEERVI